METQAPSRPALRSPWLGAPLGLAVAALAVAIAFAPSAPVDGVDSASDAAAARLHLTALAERPRPAESPANEAAREHITRAIQDAGLELTTQVGLRRGHERRMRRQSGPLLEAPARDREVEVTNLMTRVAGDGSGGLVLFVAHYDSRSDSPGAADNGVAVACLLERLGQLARRHGSRNDLAFLFTDGEELGLLGARLFVEEHPWFDEASCLVNLDAIGNDGPLVLFQTGPVGGALLELFADVAPRPVGTSLASTVYALLPNDTDFTPFLEHGLPGFNLAMVGGGSAYHADFDLPEHVPDGRLQHLGDTLAALIDGLAGLSLEEPSPTPTFFDVAGLGLLRLSPVATRLLNVLGWLLLGLGVGLDLVRRGVTLRERLGALLPLLVFVVAGTLLLTLEWFVLHHLAVWWVDAPPLMGRGNATSSTLTLAGLGTLGLVVTAGFLHVQESGHGAARERRTITRMACLPWLALLPMLYLLDPGAAAQLPLVAGLVGMALLVGESVPLAHPLAASLGIYLLAPHLALTFHLLSTHPSSAVSTCALVMLAGGGLFLPWLARHRHPLWMLVVLELLGSGLLFAGGRLAALGG